MYEVYFFNTGFSRSGFETWQEGLSYIIEKCFEGAVYDTSGELVVSWSPISGILWQREKDQ